MYVSSTPNKLGHIFLSFWLYAVSSLVHAGFSSFGKQGLLSSVMCRQASHCRGFSCCWGIGCRACRLQELQHVNSVVGSSGLESTGSVVLAHGLKSLPWHMGSSQTRINPCLLHTACRLITLFPWATRKPRIFLNPIFLGLTTYFEWHLLCVTIVFGWLVLFLKDYLKYYITSPDFLLFLYLFCFMNQTSMRIIICYWIFQFI